MLDESQIIYLRDVLGIQNVVLPGVLVPTAPPPAAVPEDAAIEKPPDTKIKGSLSGSRIIVCVSPAVSEFPLFGEAEQLADRMVKAMKLEAPDVLWIEWPATDAGTIPEDALDLVAQAAHRPILVFGREAAEVLTGQNVTPGKWIEFRGSKLMTTLSPKELLRAPELKKTAWAHLQAVMKEMV